MQQLVFFPCKFVIANFALTAMAWSKANYWFEYVPSAANLADLPSRGDVDVLNELRATRVNTMWPSIRQLESPSQLFV